MVFQKKVKLISSEKLTSDLFRLRFFCPEVAKGAKPGNFAHIRISQNTTPLLRRAFSIFDVDLKKKTFDILFKVVGLGTKILSEKKKGESLDVLGPLGNSFLISSKEQNLVLVAGGMGIAPLMFLASYLVKSEKIKREKISFLYGEKTKNNFVCLGQLKKLGVKTVLTTEDGTKGFKGKVTDLFLKRRIKLGIGKNCFIYSCGPQKMMKKMSELSKKYDLFCQLSLETHMPCGLGACFGCVVKYIKNDTTPLAGQATYKRICVDGPIFDAREVELD